MTKIITDNMAYAKVVKAMGFRTNYGTTDFSTILPEELEETLKSAAAISMGTEISESDLIHIHLLADQVISISQYRTELFEYLRNRMAAIAPNLTALVGELVGARLIAHSGNLLNLAKHPASTIQILGAEKALFRALKTKHDTPKYGLIFHASLVGQAPPKLKGKMARMVATKTALSIRLDALADADTKASDEAATIGIENRAKLEARLRLLEQGLGHTSIRSLAKASAGGPSSTTKKFEPRGTGAAYNTAADSLLPTQNGETPSKKRPLIEEVEAAPAGETDKERRKREKKEAKKAAKAAGAEGDAVQEAAADMSVDVEDDAAKAERKRLKKEARAAAKAAEADGAAAASNGVSDKKKKRSADDDAEGGEKPKKKKSKKSE